MWINKLLEMKKASNMITKELSEKSGVPVGTLNKLLAGQTKDPKLETIKAIVYAMGYTLNDLFIEDGNRAIVLYKKDEQNHIEKYRRLNDHGKLTVDIITDHELSCIEQTSTTHSDKNLKVASPVMIPGKDGPKDIIK